MRLDLNQKSQQEGFALSDSLRPSLAFLMPRQKCKHVVPGHFQIISCFNYTVVTARSLERITQKGELDRHLLLWHLQKTLDAFQALPRRFPVALDSEVLRSRSFSWVPFTQISEGFLFSRRHSPVSSAHLVDKFLYHPACRIPEQCFENTCTPDLNLYSFKQFKIV